MEGVEDGSPRRHGEHGEEKSGEKEFTMEARRAWRGKEVVEKGLLGYEKNCNW
jgi:hypothetical protein